ncbi:MAG: hypothetical protein AB7O65_13895 [Candidatus Korobacteraceae bacterium]
MATAVNPPNNKPVLWLATDEATEPYLHQLDGDCDCKSCESRKSRIILPQ